MLFLQTKFVKCTKILYKNYVALFINFWLENTVVWIEIRTPENPIDSQKFLFNFKGYILLVSKWLKFQNLKPLD